ncbi:hypothetical protein BMS3Abin04_01501 [bacterium BMS3Abin04]|nr:hypothetical protein BMS3Abin04_01501 [bacterium BMS3Abin04]
MSKKIKKVIICSEVQTAIKQLTPDFIEIDFELLMLIIKRNKECKKIVSNLIKENLSRVPFFFRPTVRKYINELLDN